jgi:hypothetical protein
MIDVLLFVVVIGAMAFALTVDLAALLGFLRRRWGPPT